MFSYDHIWIVIFAVILSLVFIIGLIVYVNRLFINSSQEVLVKFILLVFTTLVGIYTVDKIIAFKISLLSEEEDKQLFDLIKTLVLMIFSYYFGSKTSENRNSQPDRD